MRSPKSSRWMRTSSWARRMKKATVQRITSCSRWSPRASGPKVGNSQLKRVDPSGFATAFTPFFQAIVAAFRSTRWLATAWCRARRSSHWYSALRRRAAGRLRATACCEELNATSVWSGGGSSEGGRGSSGGSFGSIFRTYLSISKRSSCSSLNCLRCARCLPSAAPAPPSWPTPKSCRRAASAAVITSKVSCSRFRRAMLLDSLLVWVWNSSSVRRGPAALFLLPERAIRAGLVASDLILRRQRVFSRPVLPERPRSSAGFPAPSRAGLGDRRGSCAVGQVSLLASAPAAPGRAVSSDPAVLAAPSEWRRSLRLGTLAYWRRLPAQRASVDSTRRPCGEMGGSAARSSEKTLRTFTAKQASKSAMDTPSAGPCTPVP
mmetsp:Transcript_24629/g.69231  ORF Transcript_24629/g.69231 Transcript_24629/m.69231 type:complete len:378 (-) Transcript_24629:49-1182(-)